MKCFQSYDFIVVIPLFYNVGVDECFDSELFHPRETTKMEESNMMCVSVMEMN